MNGHGAPEGDSPADAIREVHSRLEEFLESFRSLDFDHFIGLWSHSPTVFHPFSQVAARLGGPDEVERAWAAIFDAVRASRPGPPYLELHARDVDLPPMDPDAVVATFHLDLQEAVGRRTLVFARREGAWKIAHLHASNMPRAE